MDVLGSQSSTTDVPSSGLVVVEVASLWFPVGSVVYSGAESSLDPTVSVVSGSKATTTDSANVPVVPPVWLPVGSAIYAGSESNLDATDLVVSGSKATTTDEAIPFAAVSPIWLPLGSAMYSGYESNQGLDSLPVKRGNTTDSPNSGSIVVTVTGQAATTTSLAAAGLPLMSIVGGQASTIDTGRVGVSSEFISVVGAKAFTTETVVSGGPPSGITVIGSKATTTDAGNSRQAQPLWFTFGSVIYSGFESNIGIKKAVDGGAATTLDTAATGVVLEGIVVVTGQKATTTDTAISSAPEPAQYTSIAYASMTYAGFGSGLGEPPEVVREGSTTNISDTANAGSLATSGILNVAGVHVAISDTPRGGINIVPIAAHYVINTKSRVLVGA